MQCAQKWEFVENNFSKKYIKMSSFPIEKIRADFPILKQKVNGKQLVYFDNGATTQKPDIVISTIADFYRTTNSNVHRGVHYFSNKSTELYEEARETVRKFINARTSKEIIFTKGTTEGLNLIASSFGQNLKSGDEIILTEMEHHSNIVPWHFLRQTKGVVLKFVPITDDYQLDFEAYKKLFSEKTKLVSMLYVSNSLGTINPIEKYIDYAHSKGIPIVIDAAQSIQHIKTDVQKLDIDFLAFSGHKMYAETGIGVVYGKQELLEKLPPYQGGGDMIEDVWVDKVTYAELPLKFEAGTANYAGAISLKAAIDYIQQIGLENISEYEKMLTNYAIEKLSEIDGIKVYATSESNKTSAISFNVEGLHHYDVGTLLDQMGVAVRTGGHCTHPLMKKLNITGTVRSSLSFYNTIEEIDYFVEALKKVIKILK